MIKMDLGQFKESIEAQKAKVHAAGRPAAQAAAQVIYESARINAPVSEKTHYFYGSSYKRTGQKYGPYEPGNLRDSIYQVYSKDQSTDTKVVYHIAPNRDKAPYAWMVEFGTSRAAAQSFIGKAVHEKGGQALQAMRRTFIQRVKA